MNATINTRTLNAALRTVAASIATRSTLPALACVLLQADNETLQVTTTDLESRTCYRAEANITTPGAALIPYKLFAELVNTLPDGELSLSAKNNKLSISGVGTTANISGLDPADFPDNQTESDSVRITVDGAAFAEAVQSVTYAASTDESRPILTCVQMRIVAGTLTLAATDGYRLAETSIDCTGEDTEALVNPAILRQVAARADGELVFHVSERRCVFDCGVVEYSAQNTDGKFPDYQAIVPKHSDMTITADHAQLARLVKTAALFARDNSNIIRFSVAPGTLTVSASNSDSDSTAEMTIEGGGELEYALNARYVLDTLAALPGKHINIGLTTNNRPGLWRGENKRAMGVLMPMSPPR